MGLWGAAVLALAAVLAILFELEHHVSIDAAALVLPFLIGHCGRLWRCHSSGEAAPRLQAGWAAFSLAVILAGYGYLLEGEFGSEVAGTVLTLCLAVILATHALLGGNGLLRNSAFAARLEAAGLPALLFFGALAWSLQELLRTLVANSMGLRGALAMLEDTVFAERAILLAVAAFLLLNIAATLWKIAAGLRRALEAMRSGKLPEAGGGTRPEAGGHQPFARGGRGGGIDAGAVAAHRGGGFAAQQQAALRDFRDRHFGAAGDRACDG